MALFKILSNMTDTSKNLPNEYHQGYCYFDVNTGRFWIDTTNDASGRMSLNGNTRLFYGTCNTLASTTTKGVVCSAFTVADLVPGNVIYVKFSVTNTGAVADLKLSVNGTAAKNIKYFNNGSYANLPSAGYIKADTMISFMYDGTYWVALNINTNSTYYYEGIYSSTLSTTTAKVGTATSYTLQPGHFSFLLANSNTAREKITLNIKSTGVKDVWINGVVTSSTNYTWPAGYYIGYYDGNVYHFRTDGKMPGLTPGDILGTGTEGQFLRIVNGEPAWDTVPIYDGSYSD